MDDTHTDQLQIMKKIENYLFNLCDKLGEGSFSQVFKGINVLTNGEVAVKKIRTGDIKSKIARRLLQCEIGILKLMNHKNIIRCLDVHSSINNCYIITELCQDGDLDQYIKKHQGISQENIEKIILSVFQALQYLSNLGIIHRDLKLSNIFVHQQTYKLGDFGFAIKSNKIFKDVAIGSPVYMSPEGLIHNLYGPKTDVWSFGILMYELLHRTTPLASCKSQQQLKAKVFMTPQISVNVQSALRQLILNCLNVKQNQRYSVKQIGESAYIKKIRSKVSEKMDIEQDLTLTKFSTSTSISQTQLSFPSLTYQSAVSLIHYCRFLNKILTVSPSNVFSKLLIWISINMKKGKYISKKYPQQKQSNLRDIIKQYNQKYLAQHQIQMPIFISFQEFASQCELKSNQHSQFAQYYKHLERETQMLIKCCENGCFEVFAKRSKAKQHANSLQGRG